MSRCLFLAHIGMEYTAPNPMVGAVLVHEERVIGEGFHERYGDAHAEVNCIRSVKDADRHLIPLSVLYVSLEPCNHFGQTPPCTDLIIREGIQTVVVGCRDPFLGGNSSERGIEKLAAAGIRIISGVIEKECIHLNRRFFTYHNQHRPFIILKWAQTMDGKLGFSKRTPSNSMNTFPSRLMITNPMTDRIVHHWRSTEMGILVGTNTAREDDPQLSNRLWPGQQPIRMVIDKQLSLPPSIQLLTGQPPTIVFNYHQHSIPHPMSIKELRNAGLMHYQIKEGESLAQQIATALFQLKILSVLVEGGGQLLQSFIDEGLWDEARQITNESLFLHDTKGILAPLMIHHDIVSTLNIHPDVIRIYKNSRVHQ